ncbi:MAG TPA: beta-propeller fold lactonase family protein [Anaerolineales bacterium]|nr:beta-propeller fold lactonase family protein [Anaerolineales bacterium]
MKSLRFAQHLGTRIILAVVFVLPLIAGFSSPVAADDGDGSSGAVYTMTNAASGNEVLVFRRSANGSLSMPDSYPTDGLGSGAGLGSQGSIALSHNGRWLFAVNAGSNDISVFAVKGRRLNLIDVVGSGGEMPISLTVHDQWLYVLNAGGSGNISGFRIRENGSLVPLDGSTQPLSNGGAGDSPMPAQIAFDPEGEILVVTEKATNLIDVYRVRRGIAGPPRTNDSAGITPFGFAFDPSGHLIVSEAFGGEPGASAVSSYKLDDREVNVISPSVGTTQTAACWVVISKNGKYAYDTNTGSSSISSFAIGKDGSLTLLDPQAGLTGEGSSPSDMALSNNGRFLYALSGGTSTISIFRVLSDGSLDHRGEVSVPEGSVGLTAR